MNQEKKHYYIVAAAIMFKADNEGAVGSYMTNALVKTDEVCITERVIAQAQTSAQMAFHHKMKDMVLEVIDVTLISWTYCGYFTKEEFLKAPEGTIKTEVNRG